MSTDERPQGGPSLWLVLAMPVSLVVTVFALGFGLIVAVGLDEGGEAAPTTTTQPPAGEAGAALFASQGCGGCHTLTTAGTTGTVGPNLDETQLTADEIAAIVADGRGGMPPFSGKLSQEEISSVAAYVSESVSSP